MLKGIEIIKDRLQRKRKQYIHQGEKIEQMKCTMQNTGEEIEQLEYVLNEMEHIADVNRAPRVIPNARVEEVYTYQVIIRQLIVLYKLLLKQQQFQDQHMYKLYDQLHEK